MHTAGIICEYNPLHNGHVHQIRRTRELLGQDTAVVCAMSGNFVQRGDFAVFSKFARARAAVLAGADLVIELPVCTALSSAEGFALGGVRLLDSLGICTHISFGSEEGSLEPLYAAARSLLESDMDSRIKEALKSGKSYAAARHDALREKMGSGADIIARPNNILAVEYLKALLKIQSPMEPVTVIRQGGSHDGRDGNSASAVRRRLFSGEPWQAAVPEAAAAVFREETAAGRGPVSIKNAEAGVLYRLRTMTKEDFEALPGAGEGFGLRLMKYAASGGDIDEILEKTATKRYAVSRLRRMLLCAYLGIRERDMDALPAYVRVLGANAAGCRLLRRMRDTCPLPCVVKPARGMSLEGEAGEVFRRECAMSDLYALGFPDKRRRVGGTELKTSPYIAK